MPARCHGATAAQKRPRDACCGMRGVRSAGYGIADEGYVPLSRALESNRTLTRFTVIGVLCSALCRRPGAEPSRSDCVDGLAPRQRILGWHGAL